MLSVSPGYSQKFLNKLNKALEKVNNSLEEANKSLGSKSGSTETSAQSSQKSSKLSYDAVRDLEPPAPKIVPSTARLSVNREIRYDGFGFTDFQDGVAWVQTEANGGYTLIDTEGNRLSNYVYHTNEYNRHIPRYYNGVTVAASVKVNNKIGDWLMDKKGNMTKELTPFYPSGEGFNNVGIGIGYKRLRKAGVSKLYTGMGAYELWPVFFDTDGKILYSSSKAMGDNDDLPALRDFHDGLMAFFDFGVRKWGFQKYEGGALTVAIKPVYVAVSDFSEGLAAVRTDSGKIGFIDTTGAMVVAAKYDKVTDFKNGYAVVGDQAYIDKTGAVKMNANYAYPFDAKGYAYAGIAKESGGVQECLIDSNFSIVHVFDRNQAPGIAIRGTYYLISSLGYRLERIGGLGSNEKENPFVDGLARVFYRDSNGKATVGYVRPNGEMAILFVQ